MRPKMVNVARFFFPNFIFFARLFGAHSKTTTLQRRAFKNNYSTFFRAKCEFFGQYFCLSPSESHTPMSLLEHVFEVASYGFCNFGF